MLLSVLTLFDIKDTFYHYLDFVSGCNYGDAVCQIQRERQASATVEESNQSSHIAAGTTVRSDQFDKAQLSVGEGAACDASFKVPAAAGLAAPATGEDGSKDYGIQSGCLVQLVRKVVKEGIHLLLSVQLAALRISSRSPHASTMEWSELMVPTLSQKYQAENAIPWETTGLARARKAMGRQRRARAKGRARQQRS